MIELHSHVLHNVDDGAQDLEMAVEMVRMAQLDGIRTIVATPHVNWRWDNSPDLIATRVAELRERLAEDRLEVQILPGAEISLTRAVEMSDAELRALALGGGDWLLVEVPHGPGHRGVEILLADIPRRGHRILLAHVERCEMFAGDDGLELLSRLVSNGILASITSGSLVGRFGGTAKRTALAMLGRGLVHNVSSDAHDCDRRPPSLVQDMVEAGLSEYTQCLAHDIPAAMLASRQLPAAPVVSVAQHGLRPSRWRRRLLHGGASSR